MKALLTYYTGVIPRAGSTSSGPPLRTSARPRGRSLVDGWIWIALGLLMCSAPPAGAQEFAFPGGILWQATFDPPPARLPAFDSQRAYLVLANGTVCAVDHATGVRVWSMTGTSTVRPASSGRLLTGADGRAAWAVEAPTGRAVWRHDLGAPAAADAVAVNAGALFLTEAGEVVLLAWSDGREAWKARAPGKVSTPIAAGADRVWVGLDDGRVLAFSLADGTLVWTKSFGARILGITPIGDRLIVGSSNNFIYALQASNGGTAWRWRTGGDVVGLAVADSRRVYFTSLDAMLRAVDRRHGDLRWQRPLASRAVGGPLLADTLVVVAGVSPELRGYRTSDGGMMAAAPLPGRPLHGPFLAPAAGLVPPRLVVLAAGGHLLALGQTIEPMLVPLDVLPGRILPPEVLPEIIK